MFGTILRATSSSFQKGMTFCCSIYVKKVIKLLAFIFEQPSYSEFTFKKKSFRNIVRVLTSLDSDYSVESNLGASCLSK